METKTIRQSIVFNAAPMDVYNLLMDPKKHSAFTGGNVKMNKNIGGKFTIFDEYIRGYNVQLYSNMAQGRRWSVDLSKKF